MAGASSWDDILRATLRAAGKSEPEIEAIIAGIIKSGEGAAVAATKAVKTGEPTAAEIARMSKAERAIYNASKSAKGKEVTDAAAALSRARTKFGNVKEGEDVINATLGEAAKTKLGTEGIAQQFDQYFKKAEVADSNRILKRTLNDPDYKALQAAEDKAVKQAEDEVMAAIDAAKAAGKPMTEDEIRNLVSSKAKEISKSVTDEFEAKAAADIEAIKTRATEGNRKLSKREKEAIARKEENTYSSAKERADEIAAQAKSVAAGGEKSVATRVETLKGLTPEEQRMSGVKAKLYREKAVAESKGEVAFVDRLKKMAEDTKLLPIKDKNGNQVMEEIIVDGEKMTVPKYETPAQRNLRLQQGKPFEAKGLQEPDGKPSPTPKTDEELRNIRVEKASVVTESSKKLRDAQVSNVLKGAEDAAAASNSPAAKAALKAIKRDYERGVITQELYLEKLRGIPKISGKAVTDAEIKAADEAAKAAKAEADKVKAQTEAAMEKKFGKGYRTKAGEGGSTEFIPADVPVSQLKGRKWVRDASGKLVLAKK